VYVEIIVEIFNSRSRACFGFLGPKNKNKLVIIKNNM
jgi:hypothetical protein